MPVRLDGTAVYIEGEASQPTIQVVVFFYDSDADTFRPNLVRTGSATLIRNGSTEIQTIEFDRRFGNADGAIYLHFMHPPIERNLQVRLQADLEENDATNTPVRTSFDRTIPVVSEEEAFVPLAVQTDTSSDVNVELRSKRRLDEHL